MSYTNRRKKEREIYHTSENERHLPSLPPVIKRILRPEVAAIFLADSLICFVIKGLADFLLFPLERKTSLHLTKQKRASPRHT